MFVVKSGFPDEGELLMCTVTKVQFHSVFVTIDEYNKSGMIHISEISPGRIRNINDFVKVGKVIVCKVLKINSERGHIDLSLRRVSENQRREKLDDIKKQQKAEKIIESVASKLKEKPLEIYSKLKPFVEEFGSLYAIFEEVVEEDLSLETDLELDKTLSHELEILIRERIKPKEVLIGGDLELTSYAPDGVDVVRKALILMSEVSKQLSLRYLGAGKFKVEVVAPNYPEAEEILKSGLDIVNNSVKGTDTAVSFVRI